MTTGEKWFNSQDMLPAMEEAFPDHIVLYNDSSAGYIIIELEKFKASELLRQCQEAPQINGFIIFGCFSCYTMTSISYDKYLSQLPLSVAEKESFLDEARDSIYLSCEEAVAVIQKSYPDKIVIYFTSVPGYNVYDIDYFKTSDLYHIFDNIPANKGIINAGDWIIAEEAYINKLIKK